MVCARCLGWTRQEIAEIVRLAQYLDNEATVAGIESEAANMAGPTADPEAWHHHRESMNAGRISTHYQESDIHSRHPEWILGTWESIWRATRDEPTVLALTLDRAAAYLDDRLDQIAQDPRHSFVALADDMISTRRALENVLRAGSRLETGAPCPRCAEHDGIGLEAPPLVKRYADHDTTGASDTWHCPRCATAWSEADYRLRVAGEYLDHATRLTADQLARRLGVPASTIRRWGSSTSRLDAETGEVVARPAMLRSRGRDARGRTLYDVADAERLTTSRQAGA